MTQLTPYLGFDGQCAEAVRFYADALGAQVEMTITYGDSPMASQFPAEHHARIMHMAIRLSGGAKLFGGDRPPGSCAPGTGGFNGISLALEFDDLAAGEAAFEALAVGGTVTMPMAPSFWVERFGMLTDLYGVGWIVNAGPSKL